MATHHYRAWRGMALTEVGAIEWGTGADEYTKRFRSMRESGQPFCQGTHLFLGLQPCLLLLVGRLGVRLLRLVGPVGPGGKVWGGAKEP